MRRSIEFYTMALGFEEGRPFRVGGKEVAALAEIPLDDVELDGQYISKGSLTFELMAWPTCGTAGPASRTRNTLGLTHMALQVKDLRAVEKRMLAYGASVVESSRSQVMRGTEKIDLLVLTDPDGIRIELMEITHRG